jgi:ADP-ribose pyrophosphatase YjhB (NUDIX family)
VLDLLFRVAYRCAYRVMRVYWRVAHPRTHGALVAVWSRGEVLLVRNSYVPYHSLPGGYVRRGEVARDAAARELLEETGLRVEPAKLSLALALRHEWEGKRELVEVFELEAPERPAVRADMREVVEVSFRAVDEALALDLFPPIREVLQRRRPGGGPGQATTERPGS